MIELHNGDCLEIMRSMPDNSVDLILTDPPYYSTELHFDKEPRIDFEYWLKECKRVLTPTGILVSFADFNLLAELRRYKVFKSTYELIWEKTMAGGFVDANLRPLRSHEFIGVFTNAFKASTYNPQKVVGDFYKKTSTHRPQHLGKRKSTEIYRNCFDDRVSQSNERHPRSVLKFSNGNNKSMHPAQKTIDLTQWLIKTYSNENNTVLDCFMGSGTTGVACQNLNRGFIGIEKDAGYFEIARKRIDEALPDLLRMTT